MTTTEDLTTYLSADAKQAHLAHPSTEPGVPLFLVSVPAITWSTQDAQEVPDLVRLALWHYPGVTIQVETLENLRRET